MFQGLFLVDPFWSFLGFTSVSMNCRQLCSPLACSSIS